MHIGIIIHKVVIYKERTPVILKMQTLQKKTKKKKGELSKIANLSKYLQRIAKFSDSINNKH